MVRYGRLLTDAQWERIRPVLSQRPPRPRCGRPPADDRKVLEGILWILRSGARWQDLPSEFPSPSRCWRRLRDWEEQGVWPTIWRTFLADLNEKQQLKWRESFMDGNFAPAAIGAAESARLSGARGRGGWWWSTAAVFLWESDFTLHPRRKSGSPKRRFRRSESGDVTTAVGPRQKAARLIGDKGYDSDALRERLRRRSITLIAPHRSNRCWTKPQDGRVLRRYKKRWIVERSIAWLGNYRRLVVRYDPSLTIYQAFIHIACSMIVLRRVLK